MDPRKPDIGQVRDDQGRTIPQRIRDLREERGQPAYALAKRVGISASYMSLIENGEKVPSESVALQLAKELGDDPELYLAWVHSARLSDPERTLRGLRRYSPGRRQERARDLVDVIDEMAATPDEVVAESRLPRASERPSRSLQAIFDGPDSHDLLELGILSLTPGAIPVTVLQEGELPDGKIADAYRLDRELFPEGVSAVDLYAYRVAEPMVRRVSDRLEIGDLVVLTRSFDRKPSPDRIHAVSTESHGVILSRIQRMGTRLILLPGPGASDVEIIDLGPKKKMEGIVVGTLVLIVRSA